MIHPALLTLTAATLAIARTLDRRRWARRERLDSIGSGGYLPTQQVVRVVIGWEPVPGDDDPPRWKYLYA